MIEEGLNFFVEFSSRRSKKSNFGSRFCYLADMGICVAALSDIEDGHGKRMIPICICICRILLLASSFCF